MQIADSFAEAFKANSSNPTSLRAMNILFDRLKNKIGLIIVRPCAVDSMNLGGLSDMISLAKVRF